MTTKMLILTNCSQCPHKYWDKTSQERRCLLSHKVIDSAVSTIPSWCELMDYADE